MNTRIALLLAALVSASPVLAANKTVKFTGTLTASQLKPGSKLSVRCDLLDANGATTGLGYSEQVGVVGPNGTYSAPFTTTLVFDDTKYDVSKLARFRCDVVQENPPGQFVTVTGGASPVVSGSF